MIRIFLLSFLLLSVLQCSRYTPIADILNEPEKYQQSGSATIKGTVMSKIDVLGVSTFKILDASGEIRVVSSQSYKKGEEVVIKGHAENLLGIGQTKILIFQEDRPQSKGQ